MKFLVALGLFGNDGGETKINPFHGQPMVFLYSGILHLVRRIQAVATTEN